MGSSTIDFVEQIWAWIYCLVTNTVASKYFTLEMDMIVGGVVRIGLFIAQIFYSNLYETDASSLLFNGCCWFFYQLYILTIETKYIFFGISITQKRQLIYKIMDYFQSIYGAYAILPDQNENGELVFSTLQTVIFYLFVALMIINTIETLYQIIKYTCCFCCFDQQNEDYQTPGSIQQYFLGLFCGTIVGIIILSYTLVKQQNKQQQEGQTYVIIMLILELIILVYASISLKSAYNSSMLQQSIDFLDIQDNINQNQREIILKEKKLKMKIKNYHCVICGFCLGLFGIYIAHGICFSYIVYYICNKCLCCSCCKCLECECCSCCFCCFISDNKNLNFKVQCDNDSQNQKHTQSQQLQGEYGLSNQYQTIRNKNTNY